MSISANNLPPSPADRAAGLIRALGSLLGAAPPPTPAGGGDDELAMILDDLAALRRPADEALGDPLARAALARLTVPGGAASVDAAGWRALGQAWPTLDLVGRRDLVTRLRAADLTVAASRDGRFVTFRDATVTVIAEPGVDRLRVQRPGRADCYEQGVLVAAISIEGDRLTRETARGSEVWNANGTGTLNGVAIAARPAPRVPGEPPRRPVPGPAPANELDEPDWKGRSWMAVYGPDYDEAIAEAGGEVVEPYRAASDADVYNCHAYATTGGAGDLFDPFMRNGQPHWLDNPMAQLTGGRFGRVAADQRVHPGDVVVYQKDGKVTHTGIVTEVDPQGNPTRIESKFGILGRYEHDTHDVSPLYGAPAAFYRPGA